MKAGLMNCLVGLLFALILMACAPAATAENPVISQLTISSEPPVTEVTMSLELTSEAFVNGQSIPAKYACTGRNISPALTWNDPPAGTQSFALIMDDPDAPMGTWVHWVLFNIKSDTRSLQEDLPITERMWTRTRSMWARTLQVGSATMVPARRAVPIVTTLSSTPSIPPSIFCPGQRRNRCSRKWRDTSWHRAN